jgi:type IV pilus assembly protein PilM
VAISNLNLFYRDKPIFGLDIGFASLKVMQINRNKQGCEVTSYGSATFDHGIFKDNLISDPHAIAVKLHDLLSGQMAGEIDTVRVAMAIPAARTFIRSVILPAAAADDLNNAVRLEIEQYVPVPMRDLYTDYSIIHKTDKDIQLLVCAVPRKIADSYLSVATLLGLDVIALEPTLSAVSRLFAELDYDANLPTVLIDFGATSSDVIVFDGGVITAGTVLGGGENISELISSRLQITKQESHFMKTRYGIGPGIKQKEIRSAISAQLEQIVDEVRRVMRYYEEHTQGKKIAQIVTTGGGSNLLGLNDYLTEALRAPTRSFVPWQKLHFQTTTRPNDIEKATYITAGGLALLRPKEIFE